MKPQGEPQVYEGGGGVRDGPGFRVLGCRV